MIEKILEVLRNNPLLLLFIVFAIGFPLGKIKFFGIRFGLTLVLFVGLAVGAVDSRFTIPTEIYLLGLIIYLYMLGLGNGPQFIRMLKKEGRVFNATITGFLLVFGLAVVGLQKLLHLDPILAAGIYPGAFTNTPALAAVIEQISRSSADQTAEALAQAQTLPVIGYSIAYPFGALGVILAIAFLQRRLKINYSQDLKKYDDEDSVRGPLVGKTIEVTRDISQPVMEIAPGRKVVFGRHQSDQDTSIVTGTTTFKVGDLVTVFGENEAVNYIASILGQVSESHLDFDASQFEYQKVFVSNPNAAGKKISELKVFQQNNWIITQVRRGNSVFLPRGVTPLQLGDQIEVIIPRGSLQELIEFFGDSYRLGSNVDYFGVSLGIVLGMILGLFSIHLPGGLSISLGITGGPLVVGLILGAIGRSGRFVWQIPYNTNLALREFGLFIFLASIGIRSGYTFFQTLQGDSGLAILIGGAILTFTSAITATLFLYKGLKVPFALAVGVVTGMHTNPSSLNFAAEQSRNDLPDIGHAAVVTSANILKIIIAQLLLIIMSAWK